jgi:hypothetical protein
MFCLAVAGIVIPVVLLCVGLIVLVFSLLGSLFGLLWPALPIVLGAALVWRWWKGGSR